MLKAGPFSLKPINSSKADDSTNQKDFIAEFPKTKNQSREILAKMKLNFKKRPASNPIRKSVNTDPNQPRIDQFLQKKD